MEHLEQLATSKWWYEKAGQQMGPVSENELRALIVSKQLSPGNLVWTAGLEGWIQIEQSELAGALTVNEVVPPPVITEVIANSNNPKSTFNENVRVETPRPLEENGTDEPAWYNNKSTLWLSLLFLPLWAYGLYKTSLYPKDKKKLFVAILIGLAALGNAMDDGTGKVSVSSWDGSVDVVERYIKKSYLRDPDSYESVNWGKVYKNEDGSYQVTHTFRAKNGFGGKGQETHTFTIAKDGKTVEGHY